MSRAVLNIGLTGAPGEAGTIGHAALGAGLLLWRWEIQEATLVAEVETAFVHTSIPTLVHNLAKALGRDAIAMESPFGGQVLGPGRLAFGKFDSAKFKRFSKG